MSGSTTAPTPGPSPHEPTRLMSDRTGEPLKTRVSGTVPGAPAMEPALEAVSGVPFGRYRLQERLGIGGMGVVWKAWDTQLKRVVALKQVLAQGTEFGIGVAIAERFMREAQLAAKLKHPNIVGVHDVGENEGERYFTSEFIQGRPLDLVLESPVPLRAALGWIRAIAAALQYAHEQGVVHRDIKPGNVLIDDLDQPHLTDFGLAKEVQLAGEIGSQARVLTASGDLLGTPDYMSPEQASGDPERLGPATDQFSLGVLLYQVMTHRLPFEGAALRDLLNAIARADPVRPRLIDYGLPADLETICLKALEKSPERRYGSIGEFGADLQHFLDGEPIHARPLSAVSRLLRKAVKYRRVMIPSVLLVTVVLAWAIWTFASAVGRARSIRSAFKDASRGEALAREARTDKQIWDALVPARDAYRRILAIHEEDAEASAGLKRVETRLKQIQGAEDRSKDAWKLLEQARPSLEKAVRFLALPEYRYDELVRRVDVGVAAIEEALKLAPDLAAAHFLLGRAWNLKGYGGQAEEEWREAIRLDAGFGPARYQLGRLLLVRALLERVAPSEEERSARRPEADRLLAEAGRELAQGLQAGGGQGGVEEDALDRKELTESLAAMVKGDLENVRRTCAKALERSPGGEGCEELCWVLGCMETGEERGKAFSRALEIRPRFALALQGRGTARLEAGDRPGAIADLDAALTFDPRLAAAWLRRGEARAAGGDPTGARADLDAALEIDPRNAYVLRERGLLRADQGDVAGACADLQAALDRAPQGWPFRAALGERVRELQKR